MKEHEQSKRFGDNGATIANETFAKGKAAAEQSAQAVEQQSYSVARVISPSPNASSNASTYPGIAASRSIMTCSDRFMLPG